MENTNKVVFQSCNQLHLGCEIVDRGNHYELRVQGLKNKWRSAYFDKFEPALDAVVKMIERFGNPRYRDTGFIFYDRKNRRWIHNSTLSRVIYNAYYRNKTGEDERNVTHLDGNPFNLRRKNLRRRLVVKTLKINGGRYILLKYTTKKGDTRYAITEYNSELLKIIQSRCWCYEELKQVFTTQIDGELYPLHLLVWAFHERGLTYDNWKEGLYKVKRELRSAGLTIDHKKSSGLAIGKFDNRYINLQALPAILNSNKGQCTRRLPENCFYVPRPDGAWYGKMDTEDRSVAVCRMINNPDEKAVSNLRFFCKTGEFNEDVEYTVLDWNDGEAKETMMAAYAETKFTMEVYNLC